MKNFIKYLVIIVCVITITGCGAKEKEVALPKNLTETINLDSDGAATVCFANYDYSDTQGYVTGSKFVVFTDENNIVTKIISQEVVMSNDEEILDVFKESLERNYSTASQYGGYDYKINVSGNKLTSDVTLDYTEMDLKSMAIDNKDLKIYLNDDYKFTLSSIKSMYMSVGAECD